jgi:hypothetical protein
MKCRRPPRSSLLSFGIDKGGSSHCRALYTCNIAILTGVVPAAAQLDRGSVTGTVLDSSGAAIAGARVSLRIRLNLNDPRDRIFL